jgi:hypothetical protein
VMNGQYRVPGTSYRALRAGTACEQRVAVKNRRSTRTNEPAIITLA